MAALENRRHECFAVLLATMKPAAEAYLMAGYAEGSAYRDNARKLANNPAVKARIAELQGQVAEKLIDIKVEWIEQNVAEIAGVKIKADEITATNVLAANKLLAEIKGFMAPEKHDVTFNDLGRRLDEAIKRTRKD